MIPAPDTRMRLEAAFGPILKAAFPDEHPVTRLQVAQALSEKAAALAPSPEGGAK